MALQPKIHAKDLVLNILCQTTIDEPILLHHGRRHSIIMC